MAAELRLDPLAAPAHITLRKLSRRGAGQDCGTLAAEQDAVQPYRGIPVRGGQEYHEQVEAGSLFEMAVSVAGRH